MLIKPILLTIILINFQLAHSQNTSVKHLKNQLVDSLLKNDTDSIFIFKSDCYSCSKCIVYLGLKSNNCDYSDTYYIFWIKNKMNYIKAFDYCKSYYDSTSKTLEWIDYFFKNKDVINSVNFMKRDSILSINSEELHYEIKDSNNERVNLKNNDYIQFEYYLCYEHFNSGDFTNNLLFDKQFESIEEIIINRNFYSSFLEYQFQLNIY